MGAEYVLEMKNITKRYGENTVLEDVSLSVRPGEIHALLGENGAGKSTLMNVLFGMPVIHTTGGFEGSVSIDGEKVNIASPNEAMLKGIGMVHQEFMLLPGFTITENIKLNREMSRPNLVSRGLGKNLETLDRPAMARDARKALDKVGTVAYTHLDVYKRQIVMFIIIIKTTSFSIRDIGLRVTNAKATFLPDILITLGCTGILLLAKACLLYTSRGV